MKKLLIAFFAINSITNFQSTSAFQGPIANRTAGQIAKHYATFLV